MAAIVVRRGIDEFPAFIELQRHERAVAGSIGLVTQRGAFVSSVIGTPPVRDDVRADVGLYVAGVRDDDIGFLETIDIIMDIYVQQVRFQGEGTDLTGLPVAVLLAALDQLAQFEHEGLLLAHGLAAPDFQLYRDNQILVDRLRDEPEGLGGVRLVQVIVRATIIETVRGTHVISLLEVHDIVFAKLLGVFRRIGGPGDIVPRKALGGAEVIDVVRIALAGRDELRMSLVFQARDLDLGDESFDLVGRPAGASLGVVVPNREFHACERVTEQDFRTPLCLGFAHVRSLVQLAGCKEDILLIRSRCRRLVVELDRAGGEVVGEVRHTGLLTRHAKEESQRISLFPGVKSQVAPEGHLHLAAHQKEITIRGDDSVRSVDHTGKLLAVNGHDVLCISGGTTGFRRFGEHGTQFRYGFLKGELQTFYDFLVQGITVSFHQGHPLRRTGGDTLHDQADLVGIDRRLLFDVLFLLAGAHQRPGRGESRKNQMLFHGCPSF